LDILQERIKAKSNTLIVTPNPEMLYEASRDEELLKVLQKADYALPDGAGIFVTYQMGASTIPKFLKPFLLPYWCLQAVIHSETLTERYGERITGSFLTKDLFHIANKE
jgi:UDP-N-acetyl-D-mannosaminuronic acid transferase (WecB/TagA/CpsF family)